MTGQLYREKYPLIMSWMSAGPPFVKTSIIEPFGPAGTIAEFVTICFWKSFSMDAVGTGAPVGRRVMKPRKVGARTNRRRKLFVAGGKGRSRAGR